MNTPQGGKQKLTQDTSLLGLISKCLTHPVPSPEVYAGFPKRKREVGLKKIREVCILVFSCPLFPGSSLKKWANISSSSKILVLMGWEKVAASWIWETLRTKALSVSTKLGMVDEEREPPGLWGYVRFLVPGHKERTRGEVNPQNDWGWISGLPCERGGDPKSKLIQENQEYFCTFEFEDWVW